MIRSTRHTVIRWLEQRALSLENYQKALFVTEVFPPKTGWLYFFDRLLIWLGMLMLAVGVVFFIAYNWNELGRFAKFGLIQVLLIGALFAIWRLGIERTSGKAVLLAATVLVGALLALIGQTYQTGADPFELFAVWAVLVLPWVWVSRVPAMWVFWLGLLNLALMLYVHAFRGFWGIVFGLEQTLWLLFLFNTLALIIWQVMIWKGVDWLDESWCTRLLATVGGVVITMLALHSIFDSSDANSPALLVWVVWLAGIYVIYRRLALDIYVLAGAVLSVIVVITALLSHVMISRSFDAGPLLIISLEVIALSAAGGWWLKRLAEELR